MSTAIPPLIPGSSYTQASQVYQNLLVEGTGVSPAIFCYGDILVAGDSKIGGDLGNITLGGILTAGTITDGTFSTTGGVVTGATIIAASDNVAANSLKTAGALVNVSASPQPTVVGQVLTTTSTTTAVWQTGVDYLNTGTSLPLQTGTVNISNSAVPATGSVLIATGVTAATWQPQSALTGVSASLGYAEFVYTTQSPNNSVANTAGTSFTVSTQVYNTVASAIVASANTVQGTIWTLSAGTYVIDYEMSLTSAGSVAIWTGSSSPPSAVDVNTVAGSTTATTWIHGRAIEVVSTTLVVAIGSVTGTAAVTTAGNDAGSYMVRVAFLKVA